MLYDNSDCLLCQVESDNLLRPLSITSADSPQNRLSHLRASISKRMHFRRSARNSAASVTLPTPDSAIHNDDDDDDDDADNDNRDNDYVEHQTNSQPSTDSLESNSTDVIAARYADHLVPHRPIVSAGNRGDSATSSLQGDTDMSSCDTLPMTTAPSQPTGRLMTSLSKTGSVGGATATGVDADYLAVTIDHQPKSSVSKTFYCVSKFIEISRNKFIWLV